MLQRLDEEYRSQRTELEQKRLEVESIARLIGEVSLEIGRDPNEVRLHQLSSDHKALTLEVDTLRAALLTVRHRLDTRHQHWVQWLKHGGALSLEGLESALVVDENLLKSLRAGPESDRLVAMQKLATRFQEIWETVKELISPLAQEIETLKKRLAQLKADQEVLDIGQAPGAFPLFQAVRERLGNRAEQLGRLIEVRPDSERWWPALELCLERHRGVIVVNDESDYQDALIILRRIAPGRGEAESLLNPSETRQFRTSRQVGSLAEKVDVSDPLARNYVERLLGDITCVENAEELEGCPAARAITPDGFFKDSPIRRRLKGTGAVPLTLGKVGLERMRAEVAKAQMEAEAQLTSRDRLRDAQALATSGWLRLQPVKYYPQRIARVLIPLDQEARWKEAFGFVPVSNEDLERFRTWAWEPELSFCAQARLTVSFDEVHRIDAFLKGGGRSRLLVPIKERSLDIFGDEKRLDELYRGSALFDENRLDLASLRCFVVPEPLAWVRGSDPTKPIIVLENVATWDSYRRWNERHSSYGAVVYGGGGPLPRRRALSRHDFRRTRRPSRGVLLWRSGRRRPSHSTLRVRPGGCRRPAPCPTPLVELSRVAPPVARSAGRK